MEISNDLGELPRVVAFVDQFAVRNKLRPDIANDVNLCLDELLNNTISYGYDDECRHCIVVALTRTADKLIVETRDDGRPFDPRQPTAAIPSNSSLQSRPLGGVGLRFVKALMDRLDYSRTGRTNVTTMTKSLREEHSGNC